MKRSLSFVFALVLTVVILTSASLVSVSSAEILIVPTVVNTNVSLVMNCDEDTYIIGDANCDGKINVKDVTAVQKHQVGLLALSENGILASDINLDEKIDVRDATLIAEYIANIG